MVLLLEVLLMVVLLLGRERRASSGGKGKGRRRGDLGCSRGRKTMFEGINSLFRTQFRILL